MLHVRIEELRSSKFPLSVPLHNLRYVLGAADVDALAERVSGQLQDRIARVPAVASYHPASAAVRCVHGAGGSEPGPGGGSGSSRGFGGLPLAAALEVCRSDRGSVRLGLCPGVVVARVLRAAAAFTALPAAVADSPAPCASTGASTAVAEGTGPAHSTWATPAGEPAGQRAPPRQPHPLAAPWDLLELATLVPCLSDGGAEKSGMAAARPTADGVAGRPPCIAGAAAAANADDVCESNASDSPGRSPDPPAATDTGAPAILEALAAADAAGLELFEKALAGVPSACEAWQEFAKECQQVAAWSLQAASGARVGARIAPPAELPTWRSDECSEGGARGDAESSAASHGAMEDRAATQAPAPTDGGVPGIPALARRYALLRAVSTGAPDHPTTTPKAAPGGDEYELYGACAAVRLRLLALAVGGGKGPVAWRAASGARPAGRSDGPVATAQSAVARAEVNAALGSTRLFAEVYGRLCATAATLRGSFARELSSHEQAAQHPSDSQGAAGFASAIGDPYRADAAGGGEDAAAAAAGRVEAHAELPEGPARGAEAVRSPLHATVHEVLDVASAATGGDANMCLTTSEALLEARAVMLAAASSASVSNSAAAAGPAVATPRQAPRPPAARYGAADLGHAYASAAFAASPHRRETDLGPDPVVLRPLQGWEVAPVPATERAATGGFAGDAGSALRVSSSSAAPGRPGSGGRTDVTLGHATQTLLTLLLGTLSSAAMNLLTTPVRYSPLGVTLGASTECEEDGGGGGAGVFPAAAGASRMGVSLARAARGGSDALGAGERRDALRALLLVYVLRLMTWALEVLGVR